jgi:hypothetical protein
MTQSTIWATMPGAGTTTADQHHADNERLSMILTYRLQRSIARILGDDFLRSEHQGRVMGFRVDARDQVRGQAPALGAIEALPLHISHDSLYTSHTIPSQPGGGRRRMPLGLRVESL